VFQIGLNRFGDGLPIELVYCWCGWIGIIGLVGVDK